MKHLYLAIIALGFYTEMNAQIIDIPDPNFKNALVNHPVARLVGSSSLQDADTNNDGEISASEAEAVRSLELDNRSISSLEGLQHFIDLREIRFNNNQVTTFDSNGIETLAWVEGNDNQLTFVGLRDGYSPGYWDYYEYLARYEFHNNPIDFICKDSGDQIHYDGGATFTSYCSFTPGGEYYTIQGQTRYDNNDDGCDTTDLLMPYLTYSIFNDTSDGNIVANGLGEYAFYVANQSYTFGPVLENASYFNISPENQTASFPSDSNPFEQDFCITANGIHNDLEIIIIPINEARPGFDTNYKLIYKNKGTTSLSGSIDLSFQNNSMELISSSLMVDSELGNSLIWNFSDLNPFETEHIDFTMNINTPMETPPVNGGDILVFNASVNTTETDETPDDNDFTLNQTVVNSFDPNDKTCLTGNTITPEQVGDYLHYRIRFENTGTASAVNVVVKDNIDRNTLDLSTLVPIEASHDFVARFVDNGNKYYVEFIFENIYLPFDDANNDGYVVFKIKTLDSLIVNDIIENNARIYFDYNSPIITNVAETTVATLSTEDFNLADSSIQLYPNPTSGLLSLKSEKPIDKVEVYDISGRLIQNISIIGSQTDLEISTQTLSAGTYFVKIKSGTSEMVKKLVKE